ncbi:MAG: Lrp/AsnC family transcriptional regulator [Marivibrio sp.]|uniref:Lrp/AsnC family transcriptional regulator n=1 Tax=Marivibrio sp. TaxID=2039719 RepID=UPI0032F087BB
MTFDAADIRILEAIQDHARATLAELAERVGLSASSCQRRLQRLEQDGVVERYTAVLNEARLGYQSSVFVKVTLASQTETHLKAFEGAVAACPGVVDCFLLAGEADYLLRVVVADMRDFERIHQQHLSRLPHVQRIQSNVALRPVVHRTVPIPGSARAALDAPHS